MHDDHLCIGKFTGDFFFSPSVFAVSFLHHSSLFENIASSYTHFTSFNENFTNIFSIFSSQFRNNCVLRTHCVWVQCACSMCCTCFDLVSISVENVEMSNARSTVGWHNSEQISYPGWMQQQQPHSYRLCHSFRFITYVSACSISNGIQLHWAWMGLAGYGLVLDFCTQLDLDSLELLLNSTFGLGSCYTIISNKSYKCIVMLFCVLTRFDGHLVRDCNMTIWRKPWRFIRVHHKKIAMKSFIDKLF